MRPAGTFYSRDPIFEVEIGAPVPFHGSGALAVLSRASAYDMHHEHYDHHDILNEEFGWWNSSCSLG